MEEDGDTELLHHAYLDYDVDCDDKYTSSMIKLSTTDLLGSILYSSSSFTAVAWPVYLVYTSYHSLFSLLAINKHNPNLFKVGIAMALSGVATTQFTSQRTAKEQVCKRVLVNETSY